MTVRGHQRSNRRHTPYVADRMGHSRLGWSPRPQRERMASVWNNARDVGSSPTSAPDTRPSTHNSVSRPLPDDT
jgi:hypothetical protein